MFVHPRYLIAVALLARAAPAGADAGAYDRQEQQRLARETPAAADLLRQADTARAAGQIEKAAGLLGRAHALAPRSALPARLLCESLAALGRKQQALAACDKARSLGGSVADMRATVAAYLASDAVPSAEDMALAVHYAEEAQRREPDLHHGYAARCDIARKLGDRHMLRACLADLQRVAPEHEETRRLLALSAGSTPWRSGIGLGLIALGALATAAHAARRAFRQRPAAQRRAVSVPGTLLVLAGLLAGASGAQAAPPAAAREERASLSSYPIDDANPEASVAPPDKAGANPLEYGYLIQDLLERADAATKSGDHAAAVRYYRAVVKAVPDRSVGLAKLCAAYELAGDRDSALKACGVALTKAGVTFDDHARFVRLVLGSPEPLLGEQRGLVQNAIAHLRRQPAGTVRAEQLQCELALKLQDLAMLEACTAALTAAAPADPQTVSFQWALAMQKGDTSEARRLVGVAKQRGVLPQGIERMEALTAARTGMLKRWGLPVGLIVLLAAGLAGVAALARTVMRRREGTNVA